MSPSGKASHFDCEISLVRIQPSQPHLVIGDIKSFLQVDNVELYMCRYIRDEKPSMQGGNALQQYVPLAQLAEHMTFNHRVWSSSLQWYTNMLLWWNRQTPWTQNLLLKSVWVQVPLPTPNIF